MKKIAKVRSSQYLKFYFLQNVFLVNKDYPFKLNSRSVVHIFNLIGNYPEYLDN